MTTDKEEKYILEKAEVGYKRKDDEYKKVVGFFGVSGNFSLDILLGHLKKINRINRKFEVNSGSFKPEETDTLDLSEVYV